MKSVKSCKTPSTDYNDLCKTCNTPSICLAFGIFDSCKTKSKRKSKNNSLKNDRI
jgi:hypothetical protein